MHTTLHLRIVSTYHLTLQAIYPKCHTRAVLAFLLFSCRIAFYRILIGRDGINCTWKCACRYFQREYFGIDRRACDTAFNAVVHTVCGSQCIGRCLLGANQGDYYPGNPWASTTAVLGQMGKQV